MGISTDPQAHSAILQGFLCGVLPSLEESSHWLLGLSMFLRQVPGRQPERQRCCSRLNAGNIPHLESCLTLLVFTSSLLAVRTIFR